MDRAARADAELTAYLRSPLYRASPWRTPNGVSPQAEFLAAAARSRKRILRAGNKIGKTWALAYDCLMAMTGHHPFIKLPPRAIGWASALDWEWGVGEDLWPAFRGIMPWDLVLHTQWYRQSQPEIPRTIVFKNGNILTFKSADAKRKKFQGTPIDYLLLNEEHPEKIVEEARRGLVTRRGHLVVGLTPVERMAWVQNLEAERGTVVVRASMRDAAEAGIADREAVEDYLASLPTRQRSMREFGDFAELEGAVYPEFSRATHVASGNRQLRALVSAEGKVLAPYPLPPAWPRRKAIDFGTANPCVPMWGCLDPRNGRLWIERHFYKAGVAPSEWARFLATQPNKDVAWVADHDAGDRRELELQGMATIAAPKGPGSVMAGVMVVQRWLYQTLPDGYPRVMFVEDPGMYHPRLGRYDGVGGQLPGKPATTEQRCHGVVWEAEGYRFPERRADGNEAPDEPVKRNDHAMDALRYMIVDLETRHQAKPPPELTDPHLDRFGEERVELPPSLL